MARTTASSERAAEALTLVTDLQGQLVQALEEVSRRHGVDQAFVTTSWERDGGRHGGGDRRGTEDTAVLQRASVNVSQVHYDDLPDKRLSSATALSAIVHPTNPFAPSMHVHTSWTEMRDGTGYWRVMADLNPSIELPEQRDRFAAALREASGAWYAHGAEQGDRYFFIPALGRHRGVTHFYLEQHATADHDDDEALARAVIEAAIRTHAALVDEALMAHPHPTEADRQRQLAYHTLYLFQVTTLDRGTTSGLLVHDDNDVGILGSLPARVDRDLLGSWAAKVPEPQDALVRALVDAIGADGAIDVATKVALARAVRAHFRAHPEALALQARGDVVPPTVANHSA
ncbi:MAG: coproporphyrinogen III oxidase [Myxococcales bacterium]|nr:coproporphyrinogen III oxidase [Myxococcales bacterium]